jgi:ABC-type Fe3+/spermidine/putrescine transport system ATPase subunit
MAAGLVLDRVSKRYGATEVLAPIELAVADGEFLTILGPSGSGKTTILRLVGGFTLPSAGRILLDGADLTATPIHKRPFNTVFQDYALFPHMTVRRNVGYGLMVRGVARDETDRRVSEVLTTVGLAELAERMPAQLSGGQQQRVALARAIVLRPRIVLLDEPLSALDAELRRQMQLFLKHLQKQIRTTFLFVTHDQEEAMTMSDRIVVMSQGRIEQIGTPREIYWRPATPFVAGFLGANNLIEADARAGEAHTALGPMPVPDGADGAVLLAVRPEAIALLAPGDAPRSVMLAARVSEVVFTGSTSIVLVAPHAAPETTLRVQMPSRAQAGELAPGADLRVGWDVADIAVIAR